MQADVRDLDCRFPGSELALTPVRWESNPQVTVDQVSGFVRIHVHPRWGLSIFLSAAVMVAWVAWIFQSWKHGWNDDPLNTAYWSIFGGLSVWNIVRGVLSEETIEISRDRVIVHRSFLFGGNKEFSTSEISEFGVFFYDEDKAAGRHLGFKYKWLPFNFAHNISEADAKLVLEAVGSIGGIGKESRSDPFGKDSSLVLLDLNSPR